MSVDLLAVDQMLTAVSSDPNGLDSYALSMTFSNAAARAAANQVGSDADATKGWGDAFITACLRQLGTLGWRFTEAGQTTIDQKTSSLGADTTTLAEVLGRSGSAASTDVIGAIQAAVEPSSGGAKAAASDPVISFWWKNALSPHWLLCGLGRATGGPDQPTLELDIVQLDISSLRTPGEGLLGTAQPFRVAEPGDLFVEVLAKSLQVLTRRTVTATLDPDVFATKRSAIVSRLGDKFSDHYVLSSGGSL